MKTPSRKAITAGIFFGFFILFFGALFWYFGGIFSERETQNYIDTDESRGFTFFPFGRGDSDQGAPTNQGSVFGTGSEIDNGDSDTDNLDNEVVEEVIIDRLRLVAEVPTAGGFVYQRKVENTSLFDTAPKTEVAMRYIESESGHMYETTDSVLTNTRITNTTIPRVVEAVFLNADRLLMRYVDPTADTIKTFSAQVQEQSESELTDDADRLSRLSGVFFPDNIKDITVNQDEEVLYTQVSSSGLVAVVADALGQNKKQIFSSALKEWKPDWSGRSETITMTHYPSAISYGLSQVLNRTTERVTPLVSGKQGLDILMSPNGERTLVSYKTGNTISLFVRDESGGLQDTGLDTYAEKCVWSGDSLLAYCAQPINQIGRNAPDTWYQGVETYSDDVWRINTSDVGVKELFSPFDEGLYSLDIIDLGISNDERFLYFRDKQNLFFWTYQLEL